MKLIYSAIIATSTLFSHILCAQNTPENHLQKEIISVLIPCCAKHAPHLPALIELYEHQTVLPDEIVISLSEAHQVSGDIITKIQETAWRFPVIIITSPEKQFAGENRNNAAMRATGTILVCQDADDIPHPQRIEIIKYFFEHYEVDHLMHQWTKLGPLDKIQFSHHQDLREISHVDLYLKNFRLINKLNLTNGNIAIRRNVFDKIKWSKAPRGQDTEFNRAVYKQFKNCIGIKASLLYYRMFLSSSAKLRNAALRQDLR
jgi:glycosyltransferase involved in cell wall biosynthesis